ncbi:MAG: hypothetical protein KGJ84_03000 [Elusimicrobia bacterium]|nr:hypothetical protein [Elusimicrobiota bacterium]
MQSIVRIFLTAANMLYVSLFGGPMDGTAWDVKLKEEGFFHWGSTADTLVFDAGKAAAAGEVAKGYAPTRYETNKESGATLFSMVMAGDGRDAMEWTGRVEGERIEGMVIVRGKDGRVSRYVFTGARKTG